MEKKFNRKLLVSVFNAQEAREAIIGGGRIIDSEDPRSALGNISPLKIMNISDAVLDFKTNLQVQLSTNIGEDQLLFRRSEDGIAIEKSRKEIAGKAAQAALGVALSMGTRVHPVNFIKVGVDGMEVDKIGEVISEVVSTVRRSETSNHCQVMTVLFAQDIKLWTERRQNEEVRKTLVELREFNPASPNDADAFDLLNYAINTLRDYHTGEILFTDKDKPSLVDLINHGILPSGSTHTFISINRLFEHPKYFPVPNNLERTNQSVIKAMVDVTCDSGANAIMIDTSILSKVMNVCLVDTGAEGMIDINSLVTRNGMKQQGILGLDDLRFFVDYCHHRGITANLAGSIESYQAQQLWALIPELDQISTRGAASALVNNSFTAQPASDQRHHKVIRRSLVRGLAPPECHGVLNLPDTLRDNKEASIQIQALIEKLREHRNNSGFDDLEVYWTDSFGSGTRFDGF